MADPYTTNVGFAIPLRGSDPGTWDVPLNNNSTSLDGYFGGVQALSVTNVPVTLTSPSGVVPTPAAGPNQAQNAVLRVTGTLTGNVQITLPLPGYMIVENLTVGAFVLTFRAVAVGEVIGIEQGSTQHIYNDGTNVRFVNLPPVGSYLDICEATVPAWITACTKPPYLNCDGSTFSAVTFPFLNNKLGGNTLPDFKGRTAYYLNQGSGRLTAAGAGIDGNTRFASGGVNGMTLAANQIPTITSSNPTQSITVNPGGSSSFFVPYSSASWFATTTPATGSLNILYSGGSFGFTSSFSGSNSISVTYTNASQQSAPNAAPGVVSGIRLIRAA